MTVIGVKKYLFVGVKEDVELFFERAQAKGFIEFLTRKGKVDYPDPIQKVLTALKMLRKQPQVKQAKLTKDLNADKLVHTTSESGIWAEKLEEEIRLLKAEISRVEPLGDFSPEEIRKLEQETGRNIQFFCVKKAKLKKMELEEVLIPVGSEYDMDYFMTISHKVESFKGMIELHFDRSLSQLENDLETAHLKLKGCHQELKENAAYIDFLKEHLTTLLNAYHLEDVASATTSQMDGSLFAIEGWIPENRLHGLFPLLEGLGIHAEEVAIEDGERIPTYMENKNYGKVGEDLVHIYDTPAPQDKDPSTWVFWAFAIFFAMIISDAGYGVIFLGLALLFRKLFKKISGSGKRFLRLFTVLSVSCILWGALSGSYFGIELSPKSPMNKFSVLNYLAQKKADYHIAAKDEVYQEVTEHFPQLVGIEEGIEFLAEGKEVKDGFMKYIVFDDFCDSIFMEIALLVGMIHISLSLMRHVRRHWAGLGWIFTIFGGYLFFPKVLDATTMIHFMNIISKEAGYILGEQLFWGGIAAALILALLQKRWAGFIELTKPIELFADILSYLRLYALGLAAMILADTFNEMGMKLGFAAGFFVILAGHTINIAVGIMGGTIHGLRLNFIEWYHHSFEGGGRLFKPLKKLTPK
ncbi:V-type ATP synthase subunit I [Candidatus Neptunochlamydia vexilliferae]|uniref:V-type ATP synthase subunit I n=1 Tax=Candidatus Neptunichlamydia vexilliferae TaxID=1651774 RepID=A0ABS0AZT9_9BACT|nr:V-type ATP synthase subunit I [Candidatus Neptunochlamydia vexilliferae]MBF5059644.1 V-type ATP synthase subunit I [Candidatus Neptunochlamydia vexilliferae]